MSTFTFDEIEVHFADNTSELLHFEFRGFSCNGVFLGCGI